jgi:hypothetical protein
LQTHLVESNTQHSPEELVRLSAQSTQIDLCKISSELYRLVFGHLREAFINSVDLISNASRSNGEAFSGLVYSHQHALVDGLRYGAGATTRGERSRFAYIEGCNAIEISYIFSYIHCLGGKRAKLSASFAVIRRLVPRLRAPALPWDRW